VIQPTVPDDATAEAPIIQPEALPDLPGPGEREDEIAAGTAPETVGAESEPVVAETTPEQEPEPVAAESTHEPEPEPVEAESTSEPEPVSEPEPEREPAKEPEPEPEPAIETTLEAKPEPEAEPEPVELVSAINEPMLSAFEEPASFDEAAPAPAQEPEPQPEPAPERAFAEAFATPSTPEPEPDHVTAGAFGEPAAEKAGVPDVSATLVAWPSGAPPAAPHNGAPAEAGSFEEATSVIPAWQQTDPNIDARRTVSLQAMPPEQVAAGSSFAAILTFEAGPFAGRIVALPNQMITIGRAPDNDVVVGDPATSGHHGQIEVRTGSFWISDLGSTNGTQVNGEPVIEKQLADGDTIAIGQNTLRFTLES